MRNITRYFAVSTMCVVTGVSSVAAQAPTRHALLTIPVDSAQQERPRVIDHGDLYYTRLTIHRLGSYAMFPLFVTEYFLGDQLLDEEGSGGSKGAHSLVAGGIAALFGVNTVTGLWNLWDARHDPGAARRYLHAGLMLAADAGFLLTAASAEDPDDSRSGAERHRNIALGSMGVSAVGTVMMWLWK
jgi:hypothetical protein